MVSHWKNPLLPSDCWVSKASLWAEGFCGAEDSSFLKSASSMDNLYCLSLSLIGKHGLVNPFEYFFLLVLVIYVSWQSRDSNNPLTQKREISWIIVDPVECVPIYFLNGSSFCFIVRLWWLAVIVFDIVENIFCYLYKIYHSYILMYWILLKIIFIIIKVTCKIISLIGQYMKIKSNLRN